MITTNKNDMGKIIAVFVLLLSASWNLEAANDKVGKGVTGCVTVQVNIEVDNAFYVANGSNSNAIRQAVRTTVQDASKIYEAEFGIKFVVGEISIYTVLSNDPYRNLTGKDAFLTKLKERHDSHATAGVYDVYMLFTPNLGTDIGGAAIKVGGFYERDQGYLAVINYNKLITQHELGHLMGASHCDAVCRLACPNAEGCPPLQPDIGYQSLMCACNSQELFSYREVNVLLPLINSNLKSGFTNRSYTGNAGLSSETVNGNITFENATPIFAEHTNLTSGEIIKIKVESKIVPNASRPRVLRLIVDGSINDCGTGTTSARIASSEINPDALFSTEPLDPKFVCGTPETRLALDELAEPEVALENQLMLVPNPARGSATLTYWLDQDAAVSIYVIDPLGRKAGQVISGERLSSGLHHAKIDLKDYVSGMHIVRIDLGGVVKSVKLLVK